MLVTKRRTQCCLAGGVLLLCAAGGYYLWRSGFFDAVTSVDAMRAYIGRFAPYSHLCFFLLQLLSVVLAPIPSNISAAAGGMLFGTWPAFFLTASAVLLGSVLVFLLARALGRQFADRFVSSHVTGRYLDLIRTKTDTVLAITLLFPFFPDDLICILAGLTAIPLRRFVVIVLFTRPWGLLVASALGGATLSLSPWAMALLGAVGVAVFILGVKYGDRIERRLLTWLKRR